MLFDNPTEAANTGEHEYGRTGNNREAGQAPNKTKTISLPEYNRIEAQPEWTGGKGLT